jgi:mono/diheme cytochrome c family protein
MKLIKLILLLFPGFLLSQNIELSESIKRGKLLYQDFCVRCHLPNGKGQEGINLIFFLNIWKKVLKH